MRYNLVCTVRYNFVHVPYVKYNIYRGTKNITHYAPFLCTCVCGTVRVVTHVRGFFFGKRDAISNFKEGC